MLLKSSPLNSASCDNFMRLPGSKSYDSSFVESMKFNHSSVVLYNTCRECYLRATNTAGEIKLDYHLKFFFGKPGKHSSIIVEVPYTR